MIIASKLDLVVYNVILLHYTDNLYVTICFAVAWCGTYLKKTENHVVFTRLFISSRCCSTFYWINITTLPPEFRDEHVHWNPPREITFECNSRYVEWPICLVRDDLKLPDDGGEISKSQGRGWQFEFWLWNLLSTWRKTCQMVNCLLCFDIGSLTFSLKK